MSDTPDILAGLDMAAPPPTAEEHAAFRARMAARRAEEAVDAAAAAADGLAAAQIYAALRKAIGVMRGHATEGARNYIAITLGGMDLPFDRAELAIVRPGGLTPHEARLHAEARAEADAAILADAACLPPGVLARIAHVLRVGAKLRGCAPSETGAGQDALDHLDHAVDHLRAYEAATGDVLPRDPQTGETDAAHAAARCVLLMGLEAGR